MGSELDAIERQRELYGAPLADITARITGALSLTQGQLAGVLGLSAPMLSQLLSGHRTKIGNPAVLHRLQSLADLADEKQPFTPAEMAARLALIKDASATITGRATESRRPVLDGLRAAASATELERLAGLTTAAPLAELLRAAAKADG